uniref:EGF-like domain-containing protein n=1 Tax=Macrostomum lignano TaxID=282301 RepID=A0A1I8F837_9PLAT
AGKSRAGQGSSGRSRGGGRQRQQQQCHPHYSERDTDATAVAVARANRRCQQFQMQQLQLQQQRYNQKIELIFRRFRPKLATNFCSKIVRVYRVDLPGRGFCVRTAGWSANEHVYAVNLYPDSVVRFLTPGDWYLTLANDQQDSIAVEVEVFRTERELHLTSCLNQCSHRGYCRGSTCTCFQGFMGPDCSRTHWRSAAATGYLEAGVSAVAPPQWKGPECEVPWSECPDPLCSGNGRCQAGRLRVLRRFWRRQVSEW